MFSFRKIKFIFAYLLFPTSAVLFTWLLLLPLSWLGRTKAQLRKITSKAITFYLHLLIFLDLCSIKIIGDAPQNKCVSIYNHRTLFDALIAISHQPCACCVVKSRVAESFIYGRAVKLLGYIAASNGMNVVKNSATELDLDQPVIIFPEGTRIAYGIGKIHRSAARLALETNSPISIAIISCNPPVLNTSSKWYQIPTSKVHISVNYLPIMPITLGLESLGIQSRQLTNIVEEVFLNHIS